MLPFGFQPDEELPGGYCSRVFASCDQVLKVPFQGEEMTSGFWATLAIQDRGGARVFESDPETGAILMERIRPGTKLADAGLTDEERMDVFLAATRALADLPIDRCLPLEPDLLAGEEVFLHGDLHPENLLWGGDRWVTIDPKGLVGDACYEAVAYLRNPLNSEESVLRLDARLKRLEAEMGWSPQRMAEWLVLDLSSDPVDPQSWTGRLLAAARRFMI